MVLLPSQSWFSRKNTHKQSFAYLKFLKHSESNFMKCISVANHQPHIFESLFLSKPNVVDLRYFNLWILLIVLVWNIKGASPSGWEVAYGGEDFLATTQSLIRVETNTYVVRRG